MLFNEGNISINIKETLNELETKYNEYKAMGLNLDMSRGKPCSEQLDLSMFVLSNIKDKDDCIVNGVDYRNYSILDGIPEMKKLFSELLEVSPQEVIVGGNSSLNMMHDSIVRAMLIGNVDGDKPWSKLERVKFLCPSPGYDRHFAICEHLGIEMIIIDMTPEGPDIDTIEKLVAEDNSIRGMWCVPKYSNPDGITYSDEICKRLASMKTAAPDFRIFWDNAYVVHHLTDKPDKLLNILDECKKAGNSNRPFLFTSTSKITFPGAGVAAMAASLENINFIKKSLSIQTIGPDKLNQARHAKAFPSILHIHEHMKKQAAIIKPKFDMVLNTFEREFGDFSIASWNKPNGGYFISFNTMDGCAKDAVALAKEAGVTITPAGATFPYGKDPRDRNIRIAPTYPSIDELQKAIEIFCVCVKIATYANIKTLNKTTFLNFDGIYVK